MLRLFLFPLFIAIVFLGVKLASFGKPGDVFYSICNLAEEHYFRNDAKFVAWLKKCRVQATDVSNFMGDKALFDKIQSLLDEMGVSHFQVYSPAEDRALWKNEAVDTGLRARFVEDQLIVFRVLGQSPASEAGVKPGDDIVSANGVAEMNPQSVESVGGAYKFKRDGKIIEVNLQPRALVEDVAPKFTRMGETGVLDLGSFRSEFFEAGAWRVLVARFKDVKSLVVDVRRNSGGNFVAMLRALSPFFCQPHDAGYLLQSRHAKQTDSEMWDRLEDEYQIRMLDEFRRINLVTYGNYGCYRGPLTVLIGPETSSVAEIFSDAISRRPRTRVWGLPTAGDVVLAVWYDLPRMGQGYSVSIPEAGYFNTDDQELEGKGVKPRRELYYDLKESLAGKDSWISRALK